MSRKTLNATNLEALGAAQLAALLIEVSTGSADIKRRLRLELSHVLGPAELAHDVRKRLATLRKSTGFVGWRRRGALIKDLNTQAAMILDKIAPQDPRLALELLWDFIDLAPSVLGRVDDSKGDVAAVFRIARDRLADIAPRAEIDPESLAERVWTALQDNACGAWDGIVTLIAPSLGPAGLGLLRQHVERFAASEGDDAHDRPAIRLLRGLRGNKAAAKARFVALCLQDIAAAQGDTAAYVAQYGHADLKRKAIAAEVAGLFLTDGRPAEALTALDRAAADTSVTGQAAWDDARITALIALDRISEAQAHRWAVFAATLAPEPLRAYLKALPDFEDVAAEDRARAHVLQYPSFATALRFCLDWPDLLTAAQLVMARANQIDGDRYELLTPAAEALRSRHPLAAVLLWRAMIDFALTRGRKARYGHAADHLADCAAVEHLIADHGPVPIHADYVQALRRRHGAKASFWAVVNDKPAG